MEEEYIRTKAGVTREDGLILSVRVSIGDHSNEGIKTYNENTCIFVSTSSFMCGC